MVIPDTIGGKPVVRIDGDAFNGDGVLRSVRLPASLVEIGNMSFKNCQGLASVEFPGTLQAIGWNAFENCGLKTAVIPRSVTHVGDMCFFGCKNMASITVDPGNSDYASVDGVLYDKNVTTLLYCPAAKEGELRIPATVTTIKDWAVANCKRLTKVVVPSTTHAIGAKAFLGCDAPRETGHRMSPANRWVSTMTNEGRAIFQKQDDGSWQEFHDGGGTHTYARKKTEVTPDHVLLQDDSRNMQMRLRATGSEWRINTGEEPWNPFKEGGWEADALDTKSEEPVDPASVETLTPAAARQLTAAAGAVLALPRLRALSPEAAHELATYRVKTVVQTYTVCIPVTEERTSTYTVMVPCDEEKSPDDDSRGGEAQAKCRPELRSRTYKVTICKPEERTRTISLPATLQLDALESPDPEVLSGLAKHDGILRLDGLTALNREQAGALAAHKGGLHLNGVAVLSDDVAAALATHQGPISFTGVQTASREALALFEGKPVTLPPELSGRSPNAD